MQVNATEFKARCLAFLDDVAATGEPLTITKRGKVLARLVPAVDEAPACPQLELMGTVEILGDITSPVLPTEDWTLDLEDGLE